MPPLPGAVLLRSDVIRKELFGVDPLIALPEAAYSQEVTARVYRDVARTRRGKSSTRAFRPSSMPPF